MQFLQSDLLTSQLLDDKIKTEANNRVKFCIKVIF